MRKICDKKEKIHKKGQKSSLEPGRASGAGGFGGSGELVGEGGRAAAARAARNEMEGQHELSGGRARRGSA